MKFTRAVFAVAVLAGSMSAAAQSSIKCNPADYKGRWAFYTKGSLIDLPPEGAILVGQFAQAGVFEADGKGRAEVDSRASYNGLVLPARDTATAFTLTPECNIQFDLTLPFPLSAPSVFRGTFSDSLRQMTLMIEEPLGSVVVGQHAKQDIRFCGDRDFTGAYQVDIGGRVTSPASRAGLFHRIGRVVADGAGRFTAQTIANYGGRIVPENFSGTYGVTSACFVTLRYRTADGAFSIYGALAGSGDGAMVMMNTSGWSVSGELRGQR